MVTPDSPEATNGISKSKKTILNKTRDDDVFSFRRSGTFFNFLRTEGCGSVESYLNDKDKLRADLTLQFNHGDSAEDTGEEGRSGGSRKDRMKADKMFLKSLQTSITSLPSHKKDKVRDSVLKTVNQAADFLETREDFWNQID